MGSGASSMMISSTVVPFCVLGSGLSVAGRAARDIAPVRWIGASTSGYVLALWQSGALAMYLPVWVAIIESALLSMSKGTPPVPGAMLRRGRAGGREFADLCGAASPGAHAAELRGCDGGGIYASENCRRARRCGA